MVSKITSPVTPLELIDKTNEIIDAKQDVLTAGTDLEIVEGQQILVPDGYTQLDYLRGNGNSYINLNTVLSNDDDVEIDIILYGDERRQNIFGARSSANSKNLVVSVSSYNSATLDFNSSSYSPYRLEATCVTGFKYRLIINKNERKVILLDNDSVVAINNTVCDDVFTTPTALLFATGTNPAYTNLFTGSICRLKIGSRMLLIPAKRNSDDELGMYDVINDVFLTNARPDSFIAGPETLAQTVINFTNNTGYTTNEGTVTSVNNTQPDASGNITLSIPSEVTESTVSGWGFTKNTGTVTSVNNVQPVNGNVTLTIPDTSNLANKDLSNLSSTGEKHFLNKSQVSNCILEAPNGVLTYSGSTITLKAGLKVLVPDGRNSDGTLKSIEVTLQNDVTNTISGSVGNRPRQPIFIGSDGNIYRDVADDRYYITNGFPSQTWTVVYSPKTNITKCTKGSTDYQTVQYAFIGYVSVDSNLNVTSATIEQPVKIYTNTDNQYLSSMGMPSGTSIDLTLGASGAQYTAPANGYVSIAKVAQGVGQYIEINIQNRIRTNMLSSVSSGFGLKLFVPVRRGEVFNINYSASGNLEMFKFTYAEGEIQ